MTPKETNEIERTLNQMVGTINDLKNNLAGAQAQYSDIADKVDLHQWNLPEGVVILTISGSTQHKAFEKKYLRAKNIHDVSSFIE